MEACNGAKSYSEAALVSRALKQGDEGAFGELYKSKWRYVCSAIRKTVGRNFPYVVDDIAQETFLSAWKNRSTYEGPNQFEGWLHKIAVNASIDFLRRHRDVESLDALLPERLNSYRAPARVQYNKVLSTDIRSVANDALKSLSQTHRDVLLCRYGKEMAIDELCAALNIKDGTVKSRTNRAVNLAFSRLKKNARFHELCDGAGVHEERKLEVVAALVNIAYSDKYGRE